MTGAIRAKPEEQRAADEALLKALNHPLRRRILKTLRDADGALSPSDLSLMLREALSNVTYHVSRLSDEGAIKLVRGGPATKLHSYEVVIKEDWALAIVDRAKGADDRGRHLRRSAAGPPHP